MRGTVRVQAWDKKEKHSLSWNTVLTGIMTRMTGKLLQRWVSCDLQTNDGAHVYFHPDFGETRGC